MDRNIAANAPVKIPSDINMTVHDEFLLNSAVEFMGRGKLKNIKELFDGELKLKIKLSPFPFSKTVATFDTKADQDRFLRWVNDNDNLGGV